MFIGRNKCKDYRYRYRLTKVERGIRTWKRYKNIIIRTRLDDFL